MAFTHRVLGTDGWTLHRSDMTGLMRVNVCCDRRDLSGQLKFSFVPPETAMPTALVPVLLLIAESRPGRFMALVFAGDSSDGLHAPITTGMTPPGWEAGEARFWADAYDDLARLQSRTSQFFAVPDDFTRQDVREVKGVSSPSRGGHAKVIMRLTERFPAFSDLGEERPQ
ncbi:hypothetical protein HEP87_56340 [Streptomyces sp. S1D4-11]|nr:hypothetical protein [Streptomyces sp. S1D4-11]QIZ01293.1 hypothetical protein HEP87_56340 [Streptomyces sp. S1D4-11]